jgi:hypothetical protein
MIAIRLAALLEANQEKYPWFLLFADGRELLVALLAAVNHQNH